MKTTWKHFALTCAVLALSVVATSTGNAMTTDDAAAQDTATAGPQAKIKARAATNGRINAQLTFQQREIWRKSMVRTERPKKGCFTATYPEKTWKEVQCETPRLVPFGPRRGARPFTVGNGVDFSAQVTGNTSAAEGSFENVVGVTGVTGGGVGNKYSLQLKPKTFPTLTF